MSGISILSRTPGNPDASSRKLTLLTGSGGASKKELLQHVI